MTDFAGASPVGGESAVVVGRVRVRWASRVLRAQRVPHILQTPQALRWRRRTTAGLAALTCAFAPTLVSGPYASAAPLPGVTRAATHAPTPITGVPSRTALAIVTPDGTFATRNASQPRPALSIVKLYIADYVLRHGDGQPLDWQLCQLMVRFSDDAAAHQLSSKYPRAIRSIAREYGMTGTTPGDTWGTTTTTALDTARFLHRLRTRHPDSPVVAWMDSATTQASDGTTQNWGTTVLPGVTGTKWGWSSYGRRASASASVGPGFTVAAYSWGGLKVQNADVRPAAQVLN